MRCTVQATAGNFTDCYLDFDNNARTRRDGRFFVADNLLLADRIGAGAEWEFTKEGECWVIQATAGRFVDCYLDFDNHAQPRRDGDFVVADNLVLADKKGAGALWKRSVENGQYVFQVTAGNFVDCYLDFDNNARTRQDGRFIVSDNLLLADKKGAGAYWKLTEV